MALVEKIQRRATVSFLRKDDKVLLGFKTRKIGANKWNGYGGDVEPGETPEESASREFFEETDQGIIIPTDVLEKVAQILIHNITEEGFEFDCVLDIYFTWTWQGKLRGSQEMVNPTWFNIVGLPENMMLGDKDWLPVVLSGRRISAEVWYGPHQASLRHPTKITDASW